MLITHTHTHTHTHTCCVCQPFIHRMFIKNQLRVKPHAKGWNLHSDGGTNLADGTSQGRARKHAAGVPERAGDGAQPAREVQHSREICGSRGTQKGEGSQFVTTGVCVHCVPKIKGGKGLTEQESSLERELCHSGVALGKSINLC